MTLRDQKVALRRESFQHRLSITNLHAAKNVARVFFEHIPLAPASVVSVYWPIRHELDSRPLILRAVETGHRVALPVISKLGGVLDFRVWSQETELVGGPYGTFEPPSTSPVVAPDVVIMPLLAFDAEGYRLGYGGGYYDRTLRALRGKICPPLAVGVAYAQQEVELVPHGPGDETLDWVVTERSAQKVS